jgi:2,3-bisphosphoglycerate-independent phosphoglycerate mutase
VVLIIIDGVGVGRRDEFDAVHLARTPALDRLFDEGLYRTLRAHGTAVGLPTDSDLGGSEVGHNIMGAGRIVDQGPKLVDNAFADGSVWQGAWKDLSANLLAGGRTLHLVGLLSDGNIHSHQDHLYQLIERAAADGIARLRVHPLFDGRDVPDRSAGDYLQQLEAVLAPHVAAGRDYRIGSGGGRMLSVMDRYNADWRIVERGFNTIVHGQGPRFASAGEAVASFQAEDDELSDQYIPTFVVADGDGPIGTVADGDAVIMFNFRGDRAVELCAAFEADATFTHFDRGIMPKVDFAGMMLYDGDLGIPAHYLVTPTTTEGLFQRVPGAYRCHPVRLRGDTEIWSRHLFLEWQPLRHVRLRA